MGIVQYFKRLSEDARIRTTFRTAASTLYSGIFDYDEIVDSTNPTDQRSYSIGKKATVMIADAGLRFDLDIKRAVLECRQFVDSLDPDDNRSLAQLFLDSVHALNGFEERFKRGKRAKKDTFDKTIWKMERNAKWPLDEKTRLKIENLFGEIAGIEAKIAELKQSAEADD
jgi:hypothetical protein